MGASLDDYLRRLAVLEMNRPVLSKGASSGPAVKAYREAVVRLSLGMVAATALGDKCLDDGIRSIDRNADLQLLFRLVMECQVIDDVVDYSRDCAAGLPSFLTVFDDMPRGFEFARSAALGYADVRQLPWNGDDFPWRLALRAASICARRVVFGGSWRERVGSARAATAPVSQRAVV
jgi:hypothetical protein